MARRHSLLLAATSVLLAACADSETPFEVAPPEAESVAASAAVEVAPSGPTGLDGFHFTPPIAPQPDPETALDGSLLDLLAVEICEWDGTACVLPLVRRITAESRPPERLHVISGAYKTVWNTKGDDLDPDRTYRIRVLASGGELGHVDVDPVEPSEEPAGGDDGVVRLVPGQTLPIGFMVEEGVGERVGTDGGTVELGGGQVQLDIPAGALPNDVLLTAASTTDVPTGGPPIVPGTAWDFGPDGIQFALPIVMTLQFDPADVPSGVDANELRIHKVVNGDFEQQNAGLVDPVNGIASAEVDGFSVFVLIPRDPTNPEDIEPPVVRSMEVLDPATGTFGNAVTLNTTGGDANLTFRISITDNVTGTNYVDVRWLSPSGRQLRFPCLTSDLPTSGSDTNGQWDCQSVFPQYAEAGTWQPNIVWLRDRINNEIIYSSQQAGGFCDFQGTQCIANVPQITVNSNPEDIAPPVVQSVELSLDNQPRMFGPSVSVDASMGGRVIVLGFQATDDLSGIGGFLPFDGFRVSFTGPSNQSLFRGLGCGLTQGTNVAGFWECLFFVPDQAEAGTWNMTFLQIPDRAGNGGFSGFSSYTPNGLGQLCNPGGHCITPPTIQVTSQGDGVPPDLQNLSIFANQADVITTLDLTDNLSGVTFVRLRYRSTQAANQFQECFPFSLVAGTSTNGTWECQFTFSQFAARGQWVIDFLEVLDVAGNRRFYTRRQSDGFLCYFDQSTQTQVCQDFGTTDLILS